MENTKKLVGELLVDINRYEELIAKGEELRLLKTALCGVAYSSDVDAIKRIFNVESEEKNNA